jgi:hypothetical protein
MSPHGLLIVADAVRRYFKAHEIAAVVGECSRRARWRTESDEPIGGRVLFVPGWDDGGVLGIGERTGKAGNPRENVVIPFRFRIFAWAIAPEAESWGEHFTAADRLLETVFSSLRRSTINPQNLEARSEGKPASMPVSLFSLVQPGEYREFDENSDNLQGVEVVMKCTLATVFLDVASPIVTPSLKLHRPLSLPETHPIPLQE